ncbi:hypothetical protein ACH5RR_006382 [Cinchona calisaya]|uniref:Uncharacterized protein n=1 Tax=Cinchona calisaya TaxID=153742 RepID=A0ABD3ANU7_9GENT
MLFSVIFLATKRNYQNKIATIMTTIIKTQILQEHRKLQQVYGFSKYIHARGIENNRKYVIYLCIDSRHQKSHFTTGNFFILVERGSLCLTMKIKAKSCYKK